MKTIELLCEHIDEELADAREYAELALEYKGGEPELAQTFYKLSSEEMNHMERLHDCVTFQIEKQRQAGTPIPSEMRALYAFLHKRHIVCAEKVKILQEMFKR